MTVKIYHNPRCSKSRETLALLEQQSIPFEIELYLQQIYSVEELQTLVQKLGIKSVREMMRSKDDLYLQLGLNNPDLTEQQLLTALSQNSALLERPIVVNGEKAKIGRPPESVLAIL
ncbi:arsenate reductase [Canicola haemoglobinophilus]|uniref:Arsenate reductase n=1 Tax=Canicola haemoglobinophilus TaxID=733 RepID=A0AB38H7B0_9PAST|nr:arsenate reductase (glutaredoxin) [Canicola haemoglobinophilus]STO53448.1 arsenate reductase [Canicola haemoglobinophilus]STO53492.1 arsenate reductase [Canicola haemoglobinophilus]STO55700.1 arsenate reductase [Canicola haemoglobinophilus]STO68026.1 arsenate reductase [Canicola haemoglobinophilus]STO91825.1 arsenate reductase [Canicola haemoglobinophilus]